MARQPSEWSVDRQSLGFRQRLALLFLVLVLAMLALGIAAQRAVDDRTEALDRSHRRVEPGLGHLQAVRAAVIAADGVDERVITAVERLGALLGDDPLLADDVRALEIAVARWVPERDNSSVLLDEIDVLGSALRTEQAMLRARAEDAQWRLSLVRWVALAVLIGLMGAAAWCLQRWVTVPLREIGRAAQRVSDGDMHHPIPELGARELLALSRHVERMRSRLVGALADSERAAEALEQQGMAVVRLRAELGPMRQRLPDGVEFAARFEPAQGMLAGDWYDCLRLGEERVALAVVDVSGHGTEAGIFALRAKHLLVAALQDGRPPGDALHWLASHIGDTGERFLTAFLADVDVRRGRCRWASAGHPWAAVIGAEEVQRLGTTGPILGPLPGSWRTEEVPLPPDAVLLAYTDGLIEARRGNEQFGAERMCGTIRALRGRPPEDVVSHCLEAVHRFTGGRATDDVTVAALSLVQSGASLVPQDGHRRYA